MPPENEQDRLLREQAAVLSAAVSDMSEQMGNVSNGLASLQTYGRRSRTMIVVTIISLMIDLSLTAALTIVTFNVITNNQKTSATIGSINCLTKATANALPERTVSNNDRIAVLERKDEALAKNFLAQVFNGSQAERRRVLRRYLADITVIDKTKIPPLPVFNPHC